MKNSQNLSLLFVIFSSLISSESIAKTEGNYVSLAVIRSEVDFQERAVSGKSDYQIGVATADDYGMAIDYKYAKKFDDAFLALGAFFEMNNTTANLSKTDTGVNGENRSLTIKNRYGLRFDAGLDITESISPYLTVGVANVNYANRDWSSTPSGAVENKGNNVGGLFGAGIKFDYSTSWSCYFEWQSQKRFNAVTSTTGGGDGFDVKLDVMKFGISYNF